MPPITLRVQGIARSTSSDRRTPPRPGHPSPCRKLRRPEPAGGLQPLQHPVPQREDLRHLPARLGRRLRHERQLPPEHHGLLTSRPPGVSPWPRRDSALRRRSARRQQEQRPDQCVRPQLGCLPRHTPEPGRFSDLLSRALGDRLCASGTTFDPNRSTSSQGSAGGNIYTDGIFGEITAVPEPASAILLGLGLIVVGLCTRATSRR